MNFKSFHLSDEGFQGERVLKAFTGVGYDGGTELELSRVSDTEFSYQGELIKSHVAARLVKKWLSEDCLYFSFNKDKHKHILRQWFHYSYLPAYDHEKAQGRAKIIDARMVLKFSLYIGFYPISIPFTPTGQTNDDLSEIARVNEQTCYAKTVFLIAQATMRHRQDIVDHVADVQGKKRILQGALPFILMEEDEETLDLEPTWWIPVLASSSVRGRFYCMSYDSCSNSVEDIISAIRDLYSGAANAGLQSKATVRFIDLNKSDFLVTSLPGVGPLSMGRSVSPTLEALGRLSDGVARVESESEERRTEGKISFYGERFSRLRDSLRESLYGLVVQGQMAEAEERIAKSKFSIEESRRLKYFLQDNQ